MRESGWSGSCRPLVPGVCGEVEHFGFAVSSLGIRGPGLFGDFAGRDAAVARTGPYLETRKPQNLTVNAKTLNP